MTNMADDKLDVGNASCPLRINRVQMSKDHVRYHNIKEASCIIFGNPVKAAL